MFISRKSILADHSSIVPRGALATGYDADTACNISYFSNTRRFKTTFEFLKLISADYDIGPKRSQTAQMDAIEEFLGASHEAGKTTLIFIDEGQRLNLEQSQGFKRNQAVWHRLGLKVMGFPRTAWPRKRSDMHLHRTVWNADRISRLTPGPFVFEVTPHVVWCQ